MSSPWDTFSQVGILTAGFASRTGQGVAGAVYHVVHATGVTRLQDMGGLARQRPFVTAAFTVGCLAIAGVPPLNGYASLGLIHHGLEHEPVPFALALCAQALVVAALGRAAYLAFYRSRSKPYRHLEPASLGMRVSLGLLAAACFAFGAVPNAFLTHVAGPAASSLLHPATYASAALSSGGSLPALDVGFDYFDPVTLSSALAEVLAGIVLLVLVLRDERIARVLRPLRALHTGSVNGYAAFAAIGLAGSAYVLLA